MPIIAPSSSLDELGTELGAEVCVGVELVAELSVLLGVELEEDAVVRVDESIEVIEELGGEIEVLDGLVRKSLGSGDSVMKTSADNASVLIVSMLVVGTRLA